MQISGFPPNPALGPAQDKYITLDQGENSSITYPMTTITIPPELNETQCSNGSFHIYELLRQQPSSCICIDETNFYVHAQRHGPGLKPSFCFIHVVLLFGLSSLVLDNPGRGEASAFDTYGEFKNNRDSAQPETLDEFVEKGVYSLLSCSEAAKTRNRISPLGNDQLRKIGRDTMQPSTRIIT